MTQVATESRACPRCHAPTAAEARFCTRCGNALVGRDRAARLAMVSLVLGVIGVPAAMTVIPSIIALVFGIVALRRARRDNSSPPVQIIAITGIVLGVVGTLTSMFYW